MLNISVIWTLMEDMARVGARRYFNAAITVSHGEKPVVSAHTVAYAPNAKSRMSRVQHQTYTGDDHDLMLKAYRERGDRKLKRNRKKLRSEVETLDSFEALEELLKKEGFRIPVVEAKKVTATMRKIYGERAEEEEMTFEEKVEHRLADIENPAEREREAGIGVETAKSNPNWGLF